MLKKRKTTVVDLGDGDSVTIKKMSHGDLTESQAKYGQDSGKQAEGMRFIVARCVVNEQGERVYTDADLDKLAAEDADAINTIAVEALRFSGIYQPEKKD